MAEQAASSSDLCDPPWGPFDLSGRGICITGGGGHLGRAMAHLIARAGATVVVMGRTYETLEEVVAKSDDLRGTIVPFQGDVRNDADVAAAVMTVLDECGDLSGWVNNAYSGAGGQLLEYSREELETTTRSLADVMMATQTVALKMIERESQGAIVNISSMYGVVSPDPRVYRNHKVYHNPPAYGAMKAGLVQFTRYAGVHLAKQGIRVNCVSPGPFPNDNIRTDELFMERLRERVPLQRVGERSEAAAAVLFFLSPASSYITGTNLLVDGGWTAW